MKREIELYKSKRKAMMLLLVCLVGMAIGLWVLLNSDKAVAGWSIIILSGMGLIFALGTWLDRKPRILINEKGIGDLSMAGEVIEWEVMHDASFFDFRGQTYLRIVTSKDYKPSLPGNRFYRIDGLNDRVGIKTFYIKMNMIEADRSKLILFVRAMMKANPVRRQELMREVPGFVRVGKV